MVSRNFVGNLKICVWGQKRAFWFFLWSQIDLLDMNIHIPASKRSDIIKKLPRVANNILHFFRIDLQSFCNLEQKIIFFVSFFIYNVQKSVFLIRFFGEWSSEKGWSSPAPVISPPETYTGLINARLQFMDIDVGINGFREFWVKMEIGVWAPKAGFLNFWLKQTWSFGQKCQTLEKS